MPRGLQQDRFDEASDRQFLESKGGGHEGVALRELGIRAAGPFHEVRGDHATLAELDQDEDRIPGRVGAARGRDDEPVRERALPKSLGCGKNFGGRFTGGELERWEQVWSPGCASPRAGSPQP